MNERMITRFALVVAGLALGISLFGLWQTKKGLSALHDHELSLEAENAKLRTIVDDNQKNVVEMLAKEEMQLCLDLGGGDKCGQTSELPGGNEPQPFPDAMISKITLPTAKGAEIRVGMPAEVAKAILAEPQRLQAEGGLVPAVKDGKPAGFQLDDLRDGGLGPAIGLEKGDVLTALNGKPVRDTGELAEAWGDVETAKAWTLDVLRAGKPMKIVVETK